MTLRVENRTVVRSGLDRAGALGRSLLSTHPILRVAGGRFVSPLERAYDSVNTFPVLATPTDDARHRRGDRAAGSPADRA